MTLNEHVNINTTEYENADVFTPDEGYALWDDTETTNMDENGNPMVYVLIMIIPKSRSEAMAPHIHAKLIEPGMSVYGNVNPPVTE